MEEEIKTTKTQNFDNLPKCEDVKLEDVLDDSENNESLDPEDDFDPTEIKKQLKLLREWVALKKEFQNLVISFPYYLLARYPQLFVPKITKKAATNIPAEVTLQSGAANTRMRYEYAIAPFWKRTIAEIIDVLILLVLKVMITFSIVHMFELDTAFVGGLKSSFEENKFDDIPALDLLTFTPQFILIEFVTKFLVCLYEAVWTMKSSWNNNGATPGKILMGLKIVFSEETISFQGERISLRNLTAQKVILQQPAESPGFTKALLRAILKNVLISFLLPTCFVMFCFSDTRLTYDVIAKTFVIEKSGTVLPRRQ